MTKRLIRRVLILLFFAAAALGLSVPAAFADGSLTIMYVECS